MLLIKRQRLEKEDKNPCHSHLVNYMRCPVSHLLLIPRLFVSRLVASIILINGIYAPCEVSQLSSAVLQTHNRDLSLRGTTQAKNKNK